MNEPEDRTDVDREGRIIVRRPGDARAIDVGGFTVDVLADDADTGRRFSLIETAEAEAGLGPPLHIHRDCAEAFVVLAGRYAMHIDGREYDCPPGSFVHVPRGVVHTFRTLDAGSRKLNLYAPAGMIGYFDELAAGIATGLSDVDLDAIAERYEMTVVGPIPKGYL
ncbi:MAG TPA: cupin domain-containing protein [Candidatus Limnocylindrales bacterium]|nr:cupin domain-containing protein [Candidatus Limnocylindrales bacterium]